MCYELERRVRAFNPWPGAFMDFDGALLKVHRARVEQRSAPVGQRLIVQNQPAVGARAAESSSWRRCSLRGKNP